MIGADIRATNLLTHLESEIRKGLLVKGYEILPKNSPDADAKLTVSLRSFKFFIESGFWTGANNVSVAIKAEGDRDNEEYLNSYTFDSETRTLVVPDGSGIDAALNAALTDVMTQMLADKQLMQFLSNY